MVMRKLALSSVCLVLLLSISFTASISARSSSPDIPKSEEHGGEIETKYDGFKYETVVTLKKMRVVCGSSKAQQSNLKNACVSIVASLHCPGVQVNYVRYVRLQLVFEAKDWQARHPLGQRDLVAVADGTTVRLGTMKLATQDLDTDRGVDVLKEVLEVAIPYESFTTLAKAQNVEIKVGPSIFALKDKNLWALKDLNNRVKP
jgi:hypothetical protein